MATITTEEARTRVALQNPKLSSDEVRREADRLISTLEGIEAADALRAAINAQAVEEAQQQAEAAQRRSEAFADASSIVARSHPGWDGDSVAREAHRLAANNEAAVAVQNLRDSLAEGYDNHSAGLGRR